MVEYEYPLRTDLFLQQLLDLFIIHILNSLLVSEILLDTLVLQELETGGIKREFVLLLFTPSIMNYGLLRVFPDIVLWSAVGPCIGVLERCFVSKGRIVVERGWDVARREYGSGGHSSLFCVVVVKSLVVGVLWE